MFFANDAVAFCQNDEFVSWDGVFFDGFANDAFGGTIAVDVGCVPGVEAFVVCIFQKRESLFVKTSR